MMLNGSQRLQRSLAGLVYSSDPCDIKSFVGSVVSQRPQVFCAV
jgi:hypothetical protein